MTVRKGNRGKRKARKMKEEEEVRNETRVRKEREVVGKRERELQGGKGKREQEEKI